MKKAQPQITINRRIDRLKRHPIWRSQYAAFVNAMAALELPAEAAALSVSCGDGTWDYLAVSHNPAIERMVATDVVDCPVSDEDIERLRERVSWRFCKVSPDETLPLPDAGFDLVFHQDVIEHTAKPYLLLAENFRVLKPGGYLLCGTPNIFRPANILKLLIGRMTFPWDLTPGLFNPPCLNPGVNTAGMVHVQEFNRYQLRLMLEETGFEIISLTPCFFGVSFLKIKFRDFPAGDLGGNLCQYLFCVARKGRKRRRPGN